MAEETAKKAEAPAATEATEKVKKKKLRPTNCLFSNKRIRRKDWYYRDGKYFANKQSYKQWFAQESEKKKKAEEQAAKAAAAPDAGAQAQSA